MEIMSIKRGGLNGKFHFKFSFGFLLNPSLSNYPQSSSARVISVKSQQHQWVRDVQLILQFFNMSQLVTRDDNDRPDKNLCLEILL